MKEEVWFVFIVIDVYFVCEFDFLIKEVYLVLLFEDLCSDWYIDIGFYKILYLINEFIL